jgi:hypothetical protein
MGMVFEEYWMAHFGNVPPLGHVLRVALPDRWMRFHALPGAKRYGDTAEERAEVLVRGHAIAAAVLGDGACWCVTGQVVWADDVVMPLEWRDGDMVTRFAAELVAGVDDTLLMEIADDRGRAVYVGAVRPVVFAPYDGGFDVIMESAAQVVALRAQFLGWISARLDGL